ncbi:DUF5665 domain-containing protein [Calderihabitans maritimus]|uniref:Uncharacterized protein n=1 Tax=Calderihabitans maritimus TaxID=1246530 RepID=A0A1Z5HTK8_9FIRM|nr:DUF5665 domain-containing protein [Calderihabitans maritimus]GAW92600.1 hypothetical protein TherJR_1841 [Calderihabitans maritimus]
MREKALEEDIDALTRQVEKLAFYLEKMRLAEYVELLHKPRRLFMINFMVGVARGLGTAIGIAFLSSVLLYILKQIIVLNLPIISDFIAAIVRMVMEKSHF